MICRCQNINLQKFLTAKLGLILCFAIVCCSLPLKHRNRLEDYKTVRLRPDCVSLPFPARLSPFRQRRKDLFLGSHWETCVHACAFVINIFYARLCTEKQIHEHCKDHTCFTISPKNEASSLSTLCDVPNHLIKRRKKETKPNETKERFQCAARVSKKIAPFRKGIPIHIIK